MRNPQATARNFKKSTRRSSGPASPLQDRAPVARLEHTQAVKRQTTGVSTAKTQALPDYLLPAEPDDNTRILTREERTILIPLLVTAVLTWATVAVLWIVL